MLCLFISFLFIVNVASMQSHGRRKYYFRRPNILICCVIGILFSLWKSSGLFHFRLVKTNIIFAPCVGCIIICLHALLGSKALTPCNADQNKRFGSIAIHDFELHTQEYQIVSEAVHPNVVFNCLLCFEQHFWKKTMVPRFMSRLRD